MQKRTSTVFVELIDASEYHINSDATAVTPVLAVDKDTGRIRTENVLQLREKMFVTLSVPRESGAPVDKPHPGKTIRGIVYQRPLRGSFPVSRKLPDRVHNMRDIFSASIPSTTYNQDSHRGDVLVLGSESRQEESGNAMQHGESLGSGRHCHDIQWQSPDSEDGRGGPTLSM
jgi:hypothetical protein